jgi:hypothetical protein
MSTSTRQGVPGTGQSYSSVDYPETTPTAPWAGWVIFAATMMVLTGGFDIINGLVALLNSGYYGSHYNLLLGNLQAWGWWNVVGGVILMIAGGSLFTGSVWARILGIVLATINALAQLTFIAVFPIWALIVIAIDITVIYALTAYRQPD